MVAASSLIDSGANVVFLDREGCSPLFLFDAAGHVETHLMSGEKKYTMQNEMVELLIDKGVKADLPNTHGMTPLHEAAGKGHVGEKPCIARPIECIPFALDKV